MGFQIPPNEIDEEFLVSLLNKEEYRESRDVEYKLVLPQNNRESKKEFLADINSFANCVGGYLFYGIRTEDGIPVELVGLKNISVDQEKLRLEQLIYSCIEPRIPGIQTKAVSLDDGKCCIFIYIPLSVAQPHVVNFDGHWRFYSRNSAGKYEMDISEVRDAFLFSDSTLDKFKQFRSDRLQKILSNDTVVDLTNNPKIVLHLIPLSSLRTLKKYDVISIDRWGLNESKYFKPFSGSSEFIINFDGYLSVSTDRTFNYGYVQAFHNGIIESVDLFLLGGKETLGHKKIPLSFESAITQSAINYLNVYKLLGVEPPIMILLSFLGVKGFIIDYIGTSIAANNARPIDRDNLIIPEIMIQSYDDNIKSELKNIFRYVWNSCGYPMSLA